MRWFKHMTNSSLDEKLMRLRDQFGVEGYGVYWLVLEAIARECTAKNNKFFLELPPKSWRKITEISPKKFQLFLIFSEKLGLFSVNFSKNLIRVECPNLLKYRDEYTRKQSKTPDKLRTTSGSTPDSLTETDTDTDTETENKDIYIVGQSSQTSMNTSQTEKKTKSPPIPYAKIINYLNEKTQSNYKVTSKTTRRLIRARWRDGFTLEDFYKVIDVKTEQWLGDSNMDQYLRPQTLFSGKFEAYLNEGKRSKTIKRSNTLCSETTVHNIEVANAWLEHKQKKEEAKTNERSKEVP